MYDVLKEKNVLLCDLRHLALLVFLGIAFSLNKRRKLTEIDLNSSFLIHSTDCAQNTQAHSHSHTDTHIEAQPKLFSSI